MAEAIFKGISAAEAERDSAAELQPRVASQVKEVDRNLAFVALVAGLVFIGCSLFYVWSHQQIITLGYAISQASREEQELLQTNKKLRLELAALKSPSRIERIAMKELSLANPQKEQLIIVR